MNEQNWYAIKAIYGQAMKAKELLSRGSIDSYVPMQSKEENSKKCGEQKMVPAISNLIFIYASNREIRDLIRDYDFLHHIYDRTDGVSRPTIIPTEEMSRFIAFTKAREERLTYIDHREIDLSRGDRVRIVGGTFDGSEGSLLKVKGKRSRQVVVALDGHLAVMISQADHHSLEKI